MFGFFGKKKQKVVATIPTEQVVRRFQCVENFYSPQFSSQYVAGGVYNLRRGNSALAKAVETWASEGKVRIL